MKEMWNSRYSEEEFAYGMQPNDYFKKQIHTIQPGKILLPAEGEGRNAVYAASLGWETSAFDLSEKGKEKAFQLANKAGVAIDYQVANLEKVIYEKESFDVIALIFAHFPAQHRQAFHRKLSTFIKPSGYIILEGASKNNLTIKKEKGVSNGPQNRDMLFSIEEIKADFTGFDILELNEEIITLNEGKHHQGKASVIRFLARKQ